MSELIIVERWRRPLGRPDALQDVFAHTDFGWIVESTRTAAGMPTEFHSLTGGKQRKPVERAGYRTSAYSPQAWWDTEWLVAELSELEVARRELLAELTAQRKAAALAGDTSRHLALHAQVVGLTREPYGAEVRRLCREARERGQEHAEVVSLP